MKEPMSLPVDIIDEIERRARLEGVEPEAVASRLVAEELPRLVSDLLSPATKTTHSTRHGSESQLALPASTNGDAPAIHRGTSNDFSSRPPSVPSVDVSVRLSASTAPPESDADGTRT